MGPCTTTAAPSSGDTVLVKAGTYDAFTITKDLRVVADDGAAVVVQGPIGVNSVPGGTVWIQGLQATGTQGVAVAFGSGLFALSTDAHIRVQDCVLTGAEGVDPGTGLGFHKEGWDGVRLFQCSDVVFVDCQITGGKGHNVSDPFNCCNPGDIGGSGIYSLNSRFAVYFSTLTGGEGGTGDVSGGDGGDGCTLTMNSSLYAAGTTFAGGDGGDAEDFLGAPPPGDGGDGLFVESNSTAQLLDCSFAGGAGGFAFVFGLFGDDGQPLTNLGTVVNLPGTAQRLSMPSPVRENTAFNLIFEGEPGGSVFLGVTQATDFLPFLGLGGIIHLSPIPVAIPLGVVPPGGVLTVPASLGSLAPGVEAADFYLQAFTAGPSGALLTAPWHVLALDSAF